MIYSDILTSLDVSSCNSSVRVEVDTDELSLYVIDAFVYLFMFRTSDVSVCCALTKRDELLLRTVLALPHASRGGLVMTICSSRETFCNNKMTENIEHTQ